MKNNKNPPFSVWLSQLVIEFDDAAKAHNKMSIVEYLIITKHGKRFKKTY